MSTTDKIKNFLNKSSQKLYEYALEISKDINAGRSYDRDKLRLSAEVIRFNALLDTEFDVWTDAQINRFIDHYTFKLGIEEYPLLNEYSKINYKVKSQPVESGSPTVSSEKAKMLQDGLLEIRVINGKWKVSKNQSFQELATKEEIINDKVFSKNSTLSSEKIKELYLPREEADEVEGLYDEEEQNKVNELVIFKNSFSEIDPAKLEKTSNKNKAGGYAGVDSITKKIPKELIPVADTLRYRGGWQADINQPQLKNAHSTATPDFYIVKVKGGTSLGSVTTWEVGDWIVWNTELSKWERYPFSEYYTKDGGDEETDAIVWQPDTFAEVSSSNEILYEPVNF